jgi:hypothetical protein
MEKKNGKLITIKRVATSAKGTFGVVLDKGKPFCVTCELPWKDNEPNVSSVPAGIYEAVRVQSPRFGDTFEVAGVEGRTHILFHRGNSIKDSRGCILLAESYAPGETVESSRNAFAEFLHRTKGYDNFILQITEVY